jgi:hypothetical protein
MIMAEENKYSGKNLLQCHVISHDLHMDCPGIEPGPLLFSFVL